MEYPAFGTIFLFIQPGTSNSMRIWDIDPKLLCRNHLLGEHNELHAIWSVLTQNRQGYSRHPETLRWKGKLKALFLFHERIAAEMLARGYRHQSPLDRKRATGSAVQNEMVDSMARQREILREKGCDCRVPRPGKPKG